MASDGFGAEKRTYGCLRSECLLISLRFCGFLGTRKPLIVNLSPLRGSALRPKDLSRGSLNVPQNRVNC